MSISTTIRQHARALIGGKVAIGDVIRLTIDGAACTAIVLDTGTADMHVTGFYEDGTRWHELVRYADAWHATPGQIARLQAVAPAWELDLIALLCESNAAKEAAVWQQAAS
jgi:hypothetical protein